MFSSCRQEARHPGRCWVWGVMAAGLVLRVAVALWAAQDPGRHSLRDPYQPLAWSLLEHRQYRVPGEAWPAALWPPGYPLFLASIFAATRGSVLAALLANVLLSVGTMFVLWALAYRLLGPSAAAVAAGILALDWCSIAYTGLLGSETLATFLLTSGLALWVRLWQEQRGYGTGLACGLLFGMAVMVRSGAALVALPTLLALLLTRRRWSARLLPLGAAALLCLPWCARNQLVFGRFSTSCSGPYNVAALWLGPTRSACEGSPGAANLLVWRQDLAQEDPHWRSRDPFRLAALAKRVSVRWATDHPTAAVMGMVQGWRRTLLCSGRQVLPGWGKGWPGPFHLAFRGVVGLWPWALLIAAVWGWLSLLRRPSGRLLWMALGLFVVMLTAAAGAAGYERFRVPAVPLLALLAGSLAGKGALWVGSAPRGIARLNVAKHLHGRD